ncbi:MAG: VWA domain-containing protein [Ramlibacter sp.]|nr:VWA domain-containing protein [Ramlibacter sp.]MCW5651147.1 VWA domain-containing protein [Ramlibacter sp.]
MPPAGQARWLWLATTTAATACFLVLSAMPLRAQAAAAAPATAVSPYFFVKSDAPGLDRLPLKSTDVDVRISGVIADVTVVQHYRNEGQRPIEARYVFPGSTQAAVYGMNVRLGERLITAQIREKQQARIEYQAAQQAGKTAALLEQHQPNIFQMNVANILPGDDVRVELRYTELLVPQSGNYQFVFPTVVGPRYHSPQAQPAMPVVSQSFLHAGEPSATDFNLNVTLNAPVALREVHSPSHAVRVEAQGEQQARVRMEQGHGTNNRDFILDYRLAGDRVESGVMLYRGKEENFFLAMVQPPKAVAASAISPRDYLFVVDISGSMHGFPLDTAKKMLAELIGGLRASDSFNVLLFSGSNRMLAPRSVPATRANIDRALATINQYQGSGGTELIPALKRIYAEPKPADVSRTVVVVTDGYVSVEREAFDLVRRNLSQANLFAFGIGSSVNRHLMEGLARAGMGEPFIITDPRQAPAQAARFRQMIESPVLTSVKARFEGLDVYDVEPAQLPDVLGERPVIVFGKWRAPASGPLAGQLTIEGQGAAGPYRQSLAIGPQVSQDTAALRQLWARHRIASLSDQESLEGNDQFSARITALGLQYSLLTPYTSFIAVDHMVRRPAGHSATPVDQPSPMPEGVSDQAIGAVLGAQVPSTPEPGTWAAMGLVASLLIMLERRSRRRRRNRQHFTA